jgi:hypothetical protein
MRLAIIYEAKIPPELRALSRDYWQLRGAVFGDAAGRAVEPYICNLISKKIGDYLKQHGWHIQYLFSSLQIEQHIWLIASKDDRSFEIDGSAYQYFYDKPIGPIIDNRTRAILDKYGLDVLGKAVAVVDWYDGYGRAWTDAGIYDMKLTDAPLAAAVEALGPAGIDRLRGRLLPLMLTIDPAVHPSGHGNRQEVDTPELG